MKTLENKIDFAVIFSVSKANPNGDPLNGNRPRENYDGFGEMSDVCIKRKIRNRLQDMGERIFVQSDDRCDDGFKSLKERADSVEELKKAERDKDKGAFAGVVCKTWIDVRSFGQVFAFKDTDVSIGVRGPVSVHPAVSVLPVEIESLQITKSVNSVPGEKKSSDTMGTKHRVNHATYIFYGSINCQLAEKTGFTEEDAEKVKEALKTLFENDSSSARPDGSMEVNRVFWWRHNCKNGLYPSAKVHRSVKVVPKMEDPKSFEDYEVVCTELEGLTPEVYYGVQ